MSLRVIENPDNFRINIRKQIDKKLNNEIASLNLEKGIFNYTLKEADNRKIVKKWDNKFFVQIYLNQLRSVLANLNSKWIKSINLCVLCYTTAINYLDLLLKCFCNFIYG